VPAPLTGVIVPEAWARRRPIAVMVDDLGPARPQSGFSDASVVWHAPAEGGIPRYMLLFGEGEPPAVGPVRSARRYYIAWAAEWNAMYVHVGGSPAALATLRERGRGQLVWNADEFRWGGRYLWRVDFRYAPHNVYTDGKHLRELVKAVGAGELKSTPAPVWRFGSDSDPRTRPVGGRIVAGYPRNTVTYAYDRVTNTYLRAVTGEKAQVDFTTGERVAPKNVVIMLVRFGEEGTGHGRLEADYIGSGTAWIATNGRTVKGTWRKEGETDPTRFYDAAGEPVTLTAGQTFIQVLRTGSEVVIEDGAVPRLPREPRAPRPA
jgi:hypothetical protein